MLTGAWQEILPIGITLELFWLDMVPLGSIVPPLSMFSFWLLVPLALQFSWTTPGPWLLPLLLAILCAYGGAWLERWLRLHHNTLLGQVHSWVQHPDTACPLRAIGQAMLQRAFLQMIIFVLCFVGIGGGMAFLQHYDLLPQLPMLTWPVIYGVMALGALLSLRTRQAFMTWAIVLSSLVAYCMCC